MIKYHCIRSAARGRVKFCFLGGILMNEKNGARAGRGRLIVYCLFGLMFFFSISATMTGILHPDMTAHYARGPHGQSA